jgi:hypothetical protein
LDGSLDGVVRGLGVGGASGGQRNGFFEGKRWW